MRTPWNESSILGKRFGALLDAAGIPYRLVGGLAVFLHVDAIDPGGARMTRDVDVGVDRRHLEAIRAAVEPHGFKYQHVAGAGRFLDAAHPKPREAVHALFIGKKVRPGDLSAVPGSEPVRSSEDLYIAPVCDLVRMKLNSFRLRDKVHIQDLDAVGLITPEIEAGLPEPLRARLAEVRATE